VRLRIVFHDRRKVGEETRIQTAAEQTFQGSGSPTGGIAERNVADVPQIRCLRDERGWCDEGRR